MPPTSQAIDPQGGEYVERGPRRAVTPLEVSFVKCAVFAVSAECVALFRRVSVAWTSAGRIADSYTMPTLIRAIGRWSLAGLVLNSMIGTGVFVLPGTVGGQLGWASLYAWILAAALTGAMIFCFAEVASRFSEAGGAYLYAKAAF